MNQLTLLSKHLQGQHNQKLHAPNKGSSGKKRYADARHTFYRRKIQYMAEVRELDQLEKDFKGANKKLRSLLNQENSIDEERSKLSNAYLKSYGKNDPTAERKAWHAYEDYNKIAQKKLDEISEKREAAKNKADTILNKLPGASFNNARAEIQRKFVEDTATERDIIRPHEMKRAANYRKEFIAQTEAAQKRQSEIRAKLEPLEEKMDDYDRAMASVLSTKGLTDAQQIREVNRLQSERQTVLTDVLKLDGELHEAVRQGKQDWKKLSVRYAANPKIEFGEMLDDELPEWKKRSWDNAIKGFNGLVGTRTLNGVKIPLKFPEEDRFHNPDDYDNRSYHREGTVYMDRASNSKTVVHELGHALVHHDPVIKAESNRFLNQRTVNDKPVNLRNHTGLDYKDNEVAKPDKFVDAYIGKSYNSGQNEVISMGLQYMYDDPAKFAREDPEMFDFIVMVTRFGEPSSLKRIATQ